MGWYDSWELTDSKKVAKNWSPSKSVSNFLGTQSTIGVGGTEDRFRMALEELNRTANLLSNANDGEEEANFNVKFAGERGEAEVQQNSMTISPDLLLSETGKLRQGGSYFDAMDALNGRVLIGAHIRKNVGKEEFQRFSSSKDAVAQRAFQVVQEFNATKSLAKDWKGFVPYLEQHHQMTHATKESIETHVPDAAVLSQMGKFVAIANYNMVNSDNPITVADPKIWDIINTFNSKIGNSFSSCEEASAYLKNALENDLPPEEEGKGSKGKGNGGDGKPMSGKDIPQVLDSDVLSPNIETQKPELKNLSLADDEDTLLGQNFKVIEESSEKVMKESNNYHGHYLGQTLEQAYRESVLEHRSCIREVEKCFLFQDNELALHSRGLSAGDIDEGNLWKVRIDPDHIYERVDTAKNASHLMGILLDQSGSMAVRIKSAREVVITLLEGLKSYKSIKTMVYGHTAQEENHEDCILIPYKTPKVDNTIALAGATSRCQNLDGVAIKFMANQMAKVDVTGKRLLLVVSDGSPSGYSYGGKPAYNHVAKQVKEARKNGVQVFGIGICNAFSEATGRLMYGEGNYVIIGNVTDSLRIMTNRLKKLTASI